MAEFAAAGLASSIVTFIDASVKLTKLTRQYYKAHGTLPDDLPKCQTSVEEFRSWIEGLRGSQTRIALATTRNETRIGELVHACTVECQKVTQIFQELVVDPAIHNGSKARRFQHVQVALKAIRKAGKIKRLMNTLDAIKADLQLAMAVEISGTTARIQD
jgi:hypothetical protein